MGRAVVDAVNASPECTLVVAIDQGDGPSELDGSDVIVDFTTPDAVMATLEYCIKAGIHCVVGTTGFDETRLAQVKAWCAANPKVGVLIAPNFGIGAVLMMHFAEIAAPYFESVEIIESLPPVSARVLVPPQTPRFTRPTTRVARILTASQCTRCACVDWWHIKRCFSAVRARP
jgi:4-hydroxy-tetrahydrodipicolinate reductase